MWNGVQNSAGVLGVRADIYTCGPVAMQSGSLHPSYPDKQLKGLRRVHSHPKATHSHADERHNDLTAGPSHYCFGSEGEAKAQLWLWPGLGADGKTAAPLSLRTF